MASTGWARFAHRFGQYYRTSTYWRPPRMPKREWMFIPFGGAPPLRHKSFRSENELRQFLSERAMHSCFYSTAYWKKPYELKMDDKVWQGADLIFDLDGDHLPGVTDRDFPAMLNVIQEQAHGLWNDFLQPEFGFDEQFLQVTFSGHRGFHLHYRDPSLFHLDSEARRELVSHIRGEGVDVQGGLTRFNDDSANGWTKRIREQIPSLIDKLVDIAQEAEGSAKIMKDLHLGLKENLQREGKPGKGPASIKKLADMFLHEERKKSVSHGQISRLGSLQGLFLDLVKSDASIVLGAAGETDEVVTIDVRRQIRWPTSLHGKTGMRVTEFPLQRLDNDSSNPFDALSEAFVFGSDKSVTVEIVVDDAVLRFGNESYDVSNGDQLFVSESAATFLSLKGWGKMV
ncbi:MAG: DNA primase small subunit domain-containing protein [Candidatus Poseidoniaceae archaeon]